MAQIKTMKSEQEIIESIEEWEEIRREAIANGHDDVHQQAQAAISELRWVLDTDATNFDEFREAIERQREGGRERRRELRDRFDEHRDTTP